MTLRLRPHHLICSLGFEGKGYSDDFVANMAAIVDDRLRGPGGDAIKIEIVGQADEICAPCPSRIGTRCVAQRKVDRLDRDHGAALGIAAGDVLTWGQAQDRIAERIAPETLDQICATCRWLSLGVCKAAVEKLQAGR